MTWYPGKILLREDKDKSKPAAIDTKRLSQERAIEDMLDQLSVWITSYTVTADIFASAMYAAKTTMHDENERRVFIQDFAAALNRRGLLRNEDVDEFMRYGYAYMEK